jgi:hypothetical protein
MDLETLEALSAAAVATDRVSAGRERVPSDIQVEEDAGRC